MFADLHVHTIYSDGCSSPEEVLQKAQEAGLAVVAIADHDTIAGGKQVAGVADICLIPAVEITARCQKYENTDCGSIGIHILGYGIDLRDNNLNAFFETHAQRRRACVEALVRELNDLGIAIEYEEIKARYGTYLQMSDIERALSGKTVDPVAVGKLTAACEQQLEKVNATAAEAIGAIKSAGGIAIWAHPFISYRFGKRQLLQEGDVAAVTRALMRYGLEGLEVYYQSFDQRQREYLRELAEKNGLYMSGGSDYHAYPGRDSLFQERHTEVQKLIRLLTKAQ